eukprot:363378-Chlamydomonas_euryale.AAC.7
MSVHCRAAKRMLARAAANSPSTPRVAGMPSSRPAIRASCSRAGVWPAQCDGTLRMPHALVLPSAQHS